MCDHILGHLPCIRTDEHPGEGRGCVHHGISVDDGTHDDRTEDQ
jgi:hypothetical protein